MRMQVGECQIDNMLGSKAHLMIRPGSAIALELCRSNS